VGEGGGAAGERDGIRVVAEGVETEDERSAASFSGCDLLQGFLIGRPSRID
jgi:EAL domain-containing protein (putative c-di-GMP-specific phosphodiesterase class I)